MLEIFGDGYVVEGFFCLYLCGGCEMYVVEFIGFEKFCNGVDGVFV